MKVYLKYVLCFLDNLGLVKSPDEFLVFAPYCALQMIKDDMISKNGLSSTFVWLCPPFSGSANLCRPEIDLLHKKIQNWNYPMELTSFILNYLKDMYSRSMLKTGMLKMGVFFILSGSDVQIWKVRSETDSCLTIIQKPIRHIFLMCPLCQVTITEFRGHGYFLDQITGRRSSVTSSMWLGTWNICHITYHSFDEHQHQHQHQHQHLRNILEVKHLHEIFLLKWITRSSIARPG